MLRNYLKIALRNLLKFKVFSIINIIGLSTGIACAIGILLYVLHETSYDNYHPNSDRIYRIAFHKHTEARDTKYAGCPGIMALTLRDNFPQVEKVARISSARSYAVQYQNNIFFEDLLSYADNDIFSIFDIPFIQGNPKNALTRPNTAVITRTLAKKYFGNVNPMGKQILVESITFEITGIIESPPENTHWKYGIIMDWQSLLDEMPDFPHDSWDGGIFPTYVRINKKELCI